MPPIRRGSVTHSREQLEHLTLSASMSRDAERSMADAHQTGVPQAASKRRLEAKSLLIKKKNNKKKVGELSRVPNSAAASPHHPPPGLLSGGAC